ncbi:MAG: FAD-binding oxidoreductase [Gammaproteobacteria bacterium]|jgi:glycine/D-amino acid oxidase-like deaminating enzyme|nr:FAD-binding oxidoreductase [Gammaproteobacteria bacterium]
MTATAPKIPETSDVVIVGAGIAGITAAWFLNKAGVAVTVCEKGSIAGEQSSRNWGWIRQQGRDRSELPIVMESMRLWQEIADELDGDIGYRREGSLYLCENDAEMANHDRFMAFAPAYGLDTARLNRKQLESLMPGCPSRWQSALYTPDDGRAEPSLAVPAMARTLVGRGVRIIENCAVQQILAQNQRVTGVLSEHGEIRASSVLCAGGAWSTFLLKSCGIRLPQLTVKASVVRTAPAPLLFNGNASGSKVSFRRRLDGGYSVASSDYLEIFPSLAHLQFMPDFLPLMKTSWRKFRFRIPELTVDGNFTRQRTLNPIPSAKTIARIKSRLADRVPALAGIELVEAWSGMIDALPDVVPVLDQAAPIDGLWISTGFSGHGFGIGPGAGKLMANLIQGNEVDYNLSRFRLARFSDGSKLELGPSI